MIVGFNHNIAYKSVGFHVQTEDGGLNRPQLVSLLYHGGTIIASQKTSYADIVKVDNLDNVIEELAKEQHKEMLRRLTRGEFDSRIMELGIPLKNSSGPDPQKPTMKQTVTESVPDRPVPEPTVIIEKPIVDKFRQPKVISEPSLDDVIYAYLTAGQKR